MATRDFSRWARDVASDPLYPEGLTKDEETVALYVMLLEAMAEAASRSHEPHGHVPLPWLPSDARRRHFVN